jgi:type I restriction enzyme S subunit
LTEGWREENPAIEPAEKYLCHLNNEQKIKIKQKNEGIDVDSEYELPINWIYVCLDNILEKNRAIRYGVLKPGIDDPNGIRLIKSGQVRDGFMDLTEIYRITRDLDQQYSRTRLQGGELLLNLVGASIGRSAIAPNELRGANVSRAIAVIPILNSHSKYVQLSLQGPIGQKLIQSKTGGTAQPVLNLEEVRKLLIPLPPLSELDEIIRRVETLFTLADKIEQEVAEAMKRTEALTQAVLAKAFRGELVEREVESNEVHPT